MSHVDTYRTECAKCGVEIPKDLKCGEPCPVCKYRYPLGDCGDN